MLPTAAITIWRPSPPSAPGCDGSNRLRDLSPWTGNRPRLTTRLAWPPGPEDDPHPAPGPLTFARAASQRLTIVGINRLGVNQLPLFRHIQPQVAAILP